jgi:hypothetical protein
VERPIGLNLRFKRRDNVSIFGWRVSAPSRRLSAPLYLEPLGERILPSFTTPVTYTVNGNAHAVTLGDFTGSGILDLATANDGANGVNVLLGNGDGSFQQAVSYATGFAPAGILTADLRGIGTQDLITENQTTVSILLGNGDGTFGPPTNLGSGAFPTVAVGDFNGDGVPDLAVVNEFGDSVNVWMGNGDGTFQPPVASPAGNGISLVAADFNRDGNLDLAYVGAGQLHVLLGNGDGTFQGAADYAVGTDPRAVVAGDFSGTGVLDLAVANYVGHSVEVLPGIGDGTFGDAQTYATSEGLYSIATADFNQDGAADLLVGTFSSNKVGVMLGNGDGSFGAAQFFDAGNNTSSLAVGQMKGDSFPDVAAAGIFTGTVSVLLNDGQWSGPAVAGLGSAVSPSGDGQQAMATQVQQSDLGQATQQATVDQFFRSESLAPPSGGEASLVLAHHPGASLATNPLGDALWI